FPSEVFSERFRGAGVLCRCMCHRPVGPNPLGTAVRALPGHALGRVRLLGRCVGGSVRDPGTWVRQGSRDPSPYIDGSMPHPPTDHDADIPAPTRYLRTSWATDPFALGSYSFLPPTPLGASVRAHLAASVGARLHFAGEATSHEAPATTAGAVLSGRRAARRVRA